MLPNDFNEKLIAAIRERVAHHPNPRAVRLHGGITLADLADEMADPASKAGREHLKVFRYVAEKDGPEEFIRMISEETDEELPPPS